MKELEYPFNSEYILRKSKTLKRVLLSEGAENSFLEKKIAVLGGSTTHDIIRVLELFLLNYGIKPTFYESEYARYWQDAMFPEEEFKEFQPDIIYIHTTNRNLTERPLLTDAKETIAEKEGCQYKHFEVMWDKLRETFHAPIIQNNFEDPAWRLMGNRDACDVHGYTRFVRRLNERFADYAAAHESFYINDLHYIAAAFGLDRWYDASLWHMYKYAMSMEAIPNIVASVAGIIKSVYGKNKKALALDLDNTLWGGVIGDDGADGIEIGKETGKGQVYHEFQEYIKAQKDLGIILNVVSKNEAENALEGLNHPDGVLKPDDFLHVVADWEPKSENIKAIARSMNIGADSFVFVDDNPAEREIVRQQVPGCAVPEIGEPEDYIRVLDRSGFFEVTALSKDDINRGEMYKANLERAALQESFSDYKDYLKSLEMTGEIKPFSELYLSRIAQLTNKSNQFNLTTKRYTQEELAEIAKDPRFITLYGRLIDKFGDNGIVSLIVGEETDSSFDTKMCRVAEETKQTGSGEGDCRKEDTRPSKKSAELQSLHIRLWLMSCRVLKRDMEEAMMDALVETCKERGIKTVFGYYYPTAKNKMVERFYETMRFHFVSEDEAHNTVWRFDIPDAYENRNNVITIANPPSADQSDKD